MDLRYRGQAYELPIEVPRRLTAEVMERVVERFHVEHRRRYGYDQRFNRVEVVNLRATAIGHLPKAEFRPQPDAGPDAGDALVGSRRAHFGGEGHETAVYARERLRPGNRVLGPAVVEQSDCTTVLGPGQETGRGRLPEPGGSDEPGGEERLSMLVGTATADPITVEVIANALRSLVHEMDAAIERTSMSIIIREQHDFGMSLVDVRGYEVAGTVFAGQTLAEYAAAHVVDRGDVLMFNDPYISGGEISHLGDTMVGVPIFGEQGIIAWGIAWGHHMDIGADAPAAMPPQAIEVYQEGIQIPPVKLYAKGVLNEGVLEIVARNSRTPDMMVGDTLALVAAGKIAEKRLGELCAKFGEDVVLETFRIMFARTRETMIQLIRLLPEGRFEFEDWLDGDGVVDRPLRIHASLERQGDRVVLDFTGTDPQMQRRAARLPAQPEPRQDVPLRPAASVGGSPDRIEPELDPNQGVEDVVDVRIRPQSAQPGAVPAPVSLRHFTWGRQAGEGRTRDPGPGLPRPRRGRVEREFGLPEPAGNRHRAGRPVALFRGDGRGRWRSAVRRRHRRLLVEQPAQERAGGVHRGDLPGARGAVLTAAGQCRTRLAPRRLRPDEGGAHPEAHAPLLSRRTAAHAALGLARRPAGSAQRWLRAAGRRHHRDAPQQVRLLPDGAG